MIGNPIPPPSTGLGTTLSKVLELCSMLLADVDRNRTDKAPATVLPVMLAEIERWTPLITEIFEQAGSSVVASRDFAAAAQCARTDPAARQRLDDAIEETLLALATDEPGSYDALRLERPSDNERLISGPPPGAANRAQVAARELLTSMFSDELCLGENAVLIWDDSQFDTRSSSTFLGLARRLPEILGLPDGSVLLLFIGDGRLRYGEHCVGEQSVRYDLSPGYGLRKREALTQTRRRIAEWALNSREDAPLRVLMLGAGTSVNVGLPTGNELRNDALTRRVGFTVDEGSFSEAAEAFRRQIREAGRLMPSENDLNASDFAAGLTLERVIREEQHEEHVKLSHTLREFARRHATAIAALAASPITNDALIDFVEHSPGLILVTVNFDQVLETRLGARVRPVVLEGDFDALSDLLREYKDTGGAVPLLKLHGDIGQPQTLVANSDDTAGGLSGSRLHGLRALRDALGPVRMWWYIGYSMRDLDLLPVFGSPDFADGLTERWISPLLDPFVEAFQRNHRVARWATEHAAYSPQERAVSLTSEEFWKEMARLLTPPPATA